MNINNKKDCECTYSQDLENKEIDKKVNKLLN